MTPPEILEQAQDVDYLGTIPGGNVDYDVKAAHIEDSDLFVVETRNVNLYQPDGHQTELHHKDISAEVFCTEDATEGKLSIEISQNDTDLPRNVFRALVWNALSKAEEKHPDDDTLEVKVGTEMLQTGRDRAVFESLGFVATQVSEDSATLEKQRGPKEPDVKNLRFV